jgi:hypothetical protein
VRIIKLGLISIVILSIVVTVISLFIPSHVRVSRAIDINSSPEIVMSKIKSPLNWREWYPGADTMNKVVIKGQLKGLMLDESNILVITGITDSTVSALFAGPRSKNVTTTWRLIASNNFSVTVQWYIDFHLHWYPWEKFSSLVFDKVYGPRLEKGLEKLKAISEDRSSQNNF